VLITNNEVSEEPAISKTEPDTEQEEKKNLPLIILSIIAGLGAAAGTAGALIGKFFKPKNPKV